MSARDRIMGRLRSHLGQAATPEVREAAVAARLTARAQPGPVPGMATTDGAARMTRFLEKLAAVDASVTRLAAMTDLPAALASELRNRNMAAKLRHGQDPVFRDLDWGTIEISTGPGRVEEPASLSRAEFGMAETGTLVLASGPDNPVTLTFLGETHFVVLREADVKAGFEDMWAAFRARALDPRTVNMVTGPSRSADIGQKLQLGAHGPVALHVFLVAEAAEGPA